MRGLLAAGLLVFTVPTGAAAQPGKVHRVGLLLTTSPAAASHVATAFTEGLRALGRVEGQHLVLDFRWAEGQPARFPALATELVRLRPDVIVASSTAAAQAVKAASAAIPIVMVNAVDPVESGLVASLAQPGGNVTGLAAQLTPEIRAKLFQLLKEAVTGLTRVAVLRNAAAAQGAVWRDYEEAARELGLRLRFVDVADASGLALAFARLAPERPGALLVPVDPVLFTARRQIAAIAIAHRLPGIFAWREYTEAGGLMSYSARLTDQFRRAAGYVDRILRGAHPRTLPVEQPQAYELVLNLRTARALKLALPRSLLERADQVIE